MSPPTVLSGLDHPTSRHGPDRNCALSSLALARSLSFQLVVSLADDSAAFGLSSYTRIQLEELVQGTRKVFQTLEACSLCEGGLKILIPLCIFLGRLVSLLLHRPLPLLLCLFPSSSISCFHSSTDSGGSGGFATLLPGTKRMCFVALLLMDRSHTNSCKPIHLLRANALARSGETGELPQHSPFLFCLPLPQAGRYPEHARAVLTSMLVQALYPACQRLPMPSFVFYT